MPDYYETVLQQFTQQAAGFAASPEMNNDEALRLLVGFSGAGRDDTVLDVACGPGLVVNAFAPVVKYAIGIDLVPAMIDKARALQTEKQLTNVDWQVGEVSPLPFPDGSFSIVTSRYALHHVENPRGAFSEMKRASHAEAKSWSAMSRPRPTRPPLPLITGWKNCAILPTCAPCRSPKYRDCLTSSD
jgi:ubiquinone/menaquinone biosynthesis C-methylase UbiE